MARADLVGWTSTQAVGADGAVESEQRVVSTAPVVERTEDGARRLAASYWRELGRFAGPLFSAREHSVGVEVRFLGRGPVLLALGAVETELSPRTASASHAIIGGVLVRRRGGRIIFEQVDGDPVQLRSRIIGFHPRRGPFYGLVQRKVHEAVSRRYFQRLLRGGVT